MNGESTVPTALSRLLSASGILALGILGILALGVSRFFGAETILREVITEVIAGFGNAILILALFGLFFRTGLQSLLRRAPGGDTLAESVENLRELLQGAERRDRDEGEMRYDERLDGIAQDIRSLAVKDIPAMKSELEALRALLSDAEREKGG